VTLQLQEIQQFGWSGHFTNAAQSDKLSKQPIPQSVSSVSAIRSLRALPCLLTVCILILALIAAAAIRWEATLTYLGNFLVDSQPPQQADLILVLGGDFWGPRVVKGAELARLRYAPFALISGPPYVTGPPYYKERPEGEMAIDFLVQKGYPKELFQVFAHNANSTIDEAKALRGELARRHVRRVLLVTANYHTRRATIVLTLFCPGVRFISVPAPDANYHVAGWWNDDRSRQVFFSEWKKIVGTVLVSYPTYVVSRLFGRGMAMVLVAPPLSRALLYGGRAQQHFPNLGDPLGPGDWLPSRWPL
jgi:uncharacterized SAM-binding protein YcdF (DUF218 family)